MTIKYSDSKPIMLRPAGVWLVEINNGETRLYVVDKDMQPDNVVTLIKNFLDRDSKLKNLTFILKQIDVGEFVIQKTIGSYMADGRGINEKMEMVL
jgi:hypothetical protein